MRHPRNPGLVALLVIAVAVLVTCTDEPLPTTPGTSAPLPQVIACRADVPAGTLVCKRPPGAAAPGLALAVTLGGQGTFVQLTSDHVSYDGSQVFQADVTVQNLIAQPLGTTDGTTLDPAGIRVFFHSGPTVTGGTGSVSVANADGTGTFTGTNQPYFQYDAVLATGVTSAPRTWEWNVPPAVTTFVFEVYVTAEVQFPDGWVTVAPDAITVPSGATQPVTAAVFDVVGREQAAASTTFTTSDPNVATINAGVITAVNDGTAYIIVTSPPRAPDSVTVVVTSNGVQREWVGGVAAAPADWATAANWYPAGTPGVADTVSVPGGTATMPALGANAAVGRVELATGATLSLAGYTLTVWRDVACTGEVVGPGLLAMAGTGGKLAGAVPSVLVTGSAELAGSVTVLGDLTVRGGSLDEKGYSLVVRQSAP
jgi:hypothetical protein